MAYLKKAGNLEGAFIKALSKRLYKFQATAQICYIETTYDSEFRLNESCMIYCRENGELGKLKKFKFIRFAGHAKIRRAYNTKRLLAFKEMNEQSEYNPAFKGGKYKTYSEIPNSLKKGGEKGRLKYLTRDLTKTLSEASPTNLHKERKFSRSKPIDIQSEIEINQEFKEMEKKHRYGRDSAIILENNKAERNMSKKIKDIIGEF